MCLSAHSLEIVNYHSKTNCYMTQSSQPHLISCDLGFAYNITAGTYTGMIPWKFKRFWSFGFYTNSPLKSSCKDEHIQG